MNLPSKMNPNIILRCLREAGNYMSAYYDDPNRIVEIAANVIRENFEAAVRAQNDLGTGPVGGDPHLGDSALPCYEEILRYLRKY